jgi:hypothetical protein
MTPTLLALCHAPRLQQLALDLPDHVSLCYLPALTQLTHLELRRSLRGKTLEVAGALQSRPLARMTNLVSLTLKGFPVGEQLPSVLPPALTRLELQDFPARASNSWRRAMFHVACCQQLEELVLEGDHSRDPHQHPTLALQAIADDLFGLRQLHIPRSAGCRVEDHSGAMLPVMLSAAGLDAEQVGDDWTPMPPLIGFPGYQDVDAYAVVPPPNMGALTSLQHLTLTNWWLVVGSEATWRALGGCSSLRSLAELHASVPPPAGVTFPHLTSLKVTTSTSPGDTVTLLGAFPALREVELMVASDCEADLTVRCAGTFGRVMQWIGTQLLILASMGC